MWLVLRLLVYIGFALFLTAIVGLGLWGFIGVFVLAFVVVEMINASIVATVDSVESKSSSKLLPFLAGFFIGAGLDDND